VSRDRSIILWRYILSIRTGSVSRTLFVLGWSQWVSEFKAVKEINGFYTKHQEVEGKREGGPCSSVQGRNILSHISESTARCLTPSSKPLFRISYSCFEAASVCPGTVTQRRGRRRRNSSSRWNFLWGGWGRRRGTRGRCTTLGGWCRPRRNAGFYSLVVRVKEVRRLGMILRPSLSLVFGFRQMLLWTLEELV
jgi:hypothetical protein